MLSTTVRYHICSEMGIELCTLYTIIPLSAKHYIHDSRKADVYSMGAIICELLAFGFNITPERYDHFRGENGLRNCFQSNHTCFAHNQDVVEELLNEFEKRCPTLEKSIMIVRNRMFPSPFSFQLSAMDAATQICTAVKNIDVTQPTQND